MTIYLEEDLNTSPRLFIRTAPESRPILLLDPNPQLAGLALGKVEEFSWTTQRGEEVAAGLYFPPDYSPKRRYPLVIQGHGWSSGRFSMTGYTTTGYAAQALAARDIVVLQMDDMAAFPGDRWNYAGNAARIEMEQVVALYRYTIHALDERGLIDPGKVGLLGWSHNCDYVAWVITQEPLLLAAAVCAGESMGGYFSYMSRLGGGNNNVSSLLGGPPVGAGLDSWVKSAPSFQLSAVRTPLLLHVLSAPLYLPNQWEWFEGLRRLNRPVELVMFEGAAHTLVKPCERLAVSGRTADWFAFWLADWAEGRCAGSRMNPRRTPPRIVRPRRDCEDCPGRQGRNRDRLPIMRGRAATVLRAKARQFLNPAAPRQVSAASAALSRVNGCTPGSTMHP